MKRNPALFTLIATSIFVLPALGQDTSPALVRRISLQEAVQMALKHNHDIRIAGYTVEEKQQAKQAAKGSYFPSIRNNTAFEHVTDTQLIELGAGTLGVAGGTAIPPVNHVINQGGHNFTVSGTQ